ncbi:MAG: Ig-like domain-containing protein, partial [Sandaracinus sp.]|nr:Ig-like domain-containing protein [Sandaracinus sp.]
MNRKSRWIVLALLAALGCGDDDRSPMDGGPETDGAVDAGVDAADTTAPTFTTDPVDGESEVELTRTFAVTFSEPMNEAVGGLRAEVGDDVLTAVETVWDGAVLRVRYEWPAESAITVAIEGFEDLAGNAAANASVTFTTYDTTPPTVTAATPDEGATVAAPTTIELSFSEPMDVARGALSLVGGPGTLGETTWTSTSLSVEVESLAYDTAYALVLSDFADPAGNPLDRSVFLGDGALDFIVGADEDAPTVVASSPSEGQVEVTIGTQFVVVDFSESMAAVGTADLTSDAGGSVTDLAPTWSREGTRATF